MADEPRDYELELERIIGGAAEAVLDLSDEEIEAEIRTSGEDPDEVAEEMRRVVSGVLERHRPARPLRRGPDDLSRPKSRPRLRYEIPSTPEERRALLHLVLTSPKTAGKITLQFRNFRGLPDEDVESLLRQLAELGALDELL